MFPSSHDSQMALPPSAATGACFKLITLVLAGNGKDKGCPDLHPAGRQPGTGGTRLLGVSVGDLGWPHQSPACHASRAGRSHWVKSIASTIQYEVQGLALAPAPIGTHAPVAWAGLPL